MKFYCLLFNLVFFTPLLAQGTFVNPIMEGSDPWVIKKDSIYYGITDNWGESLVVWKSDKLTDRGIRRTVWHTPTNPDAWNLTDIWAPELHYIQGKWYIYYTAGRGAEPHPDTGQLIWHTQRIGVLECILQDPQTTAWLDRGMLYTGDDIDNWDGGWQTNIWAIDATPLEMNGKLYVIWSGWDSTANMENNGFTQQNLYIAEMENPYTVKTNRVKIAEPVYDWEQSHISPQKLNEGPQILKHLNKIYLIYSTPDYWTIEYKMGQMEIEAGKDPMDPANWYKKPTPVFEGTDDVYSVGHGSFTTSPDNSENWLMYRSKQTPEGGWHRDVRLQKFTWNGDGSPNFGVPQKAGTVLQKPSGETENVQGIEFADNFDVDNTNDGYDNWQFFGWNGNLEIRDRQLLLGAGDFQLWNGDKAVVRGYNWTDFTMETDIRPESFTRNGGVIFRVRNPGFGLTMFSGYFAGIDENTHEVYLTKVKDETESEIARSGLDSAAKDWYHLKVQTDGVAIGVYVDGKQYIYTYDTDFKEGSVGVRTLNSGVRYDNFSVVSKYSAIEDDETVPGRFRLYQNYPNPFNPSTVIGYRLPAAGDVELTVYNIFGQRVQTLVHQRQSAGTYRVVFDGSRLSSGIYEYRLKFGGRTISGKMVLLK
ncbi:MAG TPA: T9SS type A sorting domain-containing protein [Caldithrix abyssi]|uniref:T9SS type A sorting domain-containing protein n=1 Tax=Caldithrix abyssi TaxID=187145 RepID=A0A7V4U4J1_CALAY|nr:T9SS type A sorting domain-containing protein [Caldithrix abyssi]